MNSYNIKGEPVSPGIAFGVLHVIEEDSLLINQANITQKQVDKELSKLDRAIAKTLKEIEDLKSSFIHRLKKEESYIFDAFRSILHDRYFMEEVKDIIEHNKCHAEKSLDLCIKSYIKAIESSGNEYAKQGIYDLIDIGNRIIRNIIGEEADTFLYKTISKKDIIVLEQLSFSLAAAMGKQRVGGIVFKEGAGYLSHAAIILRGIGIPALGGIEFDDIKAFNNKEAIIDCHKGILIIEPDSQTASLYSEHKRVSLKSKWGFFKKGSKPAVTKDGVRIGIAASVGSIEECIAASEKDIDGIGLVRTEVLFANSPYFPDEEEQFAIYSKMAKKMKSRSVVIRTADLGGDKQFGFYSSLDFTSGGNLRGIRYTLEDKKLLIAQIRAILRASEAGNISMAFPVVDNSKEIREVKKLINKAKEQLSKEGKIIKKKIKIGAFIESRAGVENLDDILHEVDFISIGTNDLARDILGIDRQKAGDSLEEYLNPKLLRVIKQCIDKTKKHNKWITACGEITSDPGASALLVGLGAQELSLYPSIVEGIRERICNTRAKDARQMAEKAVLCKNTFEVKALIERYFKE